MSAWPGPTGTNVIGLVREAHERLRLHVAQLLHAPTTATWREDAAVFARHLVAHEAAEAQVLYPALEGSRWSADGRLADVLADGERIATTITRVRALGTSADEAYVALAEACSLFLAHAAEVERSVLPALRATIGEEELCGLGRAFAAASVPAGARADRLGARAASAGTGARAVRPATPVHRAAVRDADRARRGGALAWARVEPTRSVARSWA